MHPDPAASSAIALKAVQLLGRWNRFATAFKPYQPGCLCCMDFGIQSTQDLELSLVCHLSELHVGNDAIGELLWQGAGYRPGGSGSVVRLLQALARRSIEAPIEAQRVLVDDIEAALDVAEENQREGA